MLLLSKVKVTEIESYVILLKFCIKFVYSFAYCKFKWNFLVFVYGPFIRFVIDCPPVSLVYLTFAFIFYIKGQP